MKTRDLPPGKARVYAEKARRFEAAALAAWEQAAWDAVVSAAVHAAISAVDARCIGDLGKRAASDDHETAVALLLQVPGLGEEERLQAAKHFKALLALKHGAEYEDRLCEEGEARRAVRSLERLRDALGR